MRQQRGFSFIGLVLIVALLAFVGITAAQVAPTFTEYQTILKAVKKAAGESTVQGVRSAFDKTAAVDDIKSISGKDLDVSKAGDNVIIQFAYNKEIHLIGPTFLLIKYEGSSAK